MVVCLYIKYTSAVFLFHMDIYLSRMQHYIMYETLFSVLDNCDNVKIMYRVVIESLSCLGRAIGMWNHTKEISSLIPNFMWSILTKEGCLFNFNCLEMIFFHLLQSFDSFLEKVMNAWSFIFPKKRINDLIYYGIGILVENLVKYILWTCIVFAFCDFF